VARLLAGAGARVAHVVHSGKLRAQQTAELLATAVAPATAPKVMAGLSPNDSIKPTVLTIAGWTSDMMLVGHLPFMGKLVSRLVVGEEGKSVATFVPGTVVCLELDEANHWTIVWMVRPALATLPD
jgi:phosphohistidine phosphatase